MSTQPEDQHRPAADRLALLLGVSSDTDDDTFRRAYRSRLKQLHPDSGGAFADAELLAHLVDAFDDYERELEAEPPHERASHDPWDEDWTATSTDDAPPPPAPPPPSPWWTEREPAPQPKPGFWSQRP